MPESPLSLLRHASGDIVEEDWYHPSMIAEHPPLSEPVVRRRFTTAEYHAMAEAGVLAEDERVELITGEIVRMAPIGSRHAGCVRGLNRQLSRLLGYKASIAVQDPVVLDDTSEPEPDIAVLRFREDDYRNLHPRPADILFLIEVADTSVDYDRNVKIPLYAQAGIPEAWLVRLREMCIEIYRNPAPTGYQEMRTLRSGDPVSPLAFPDLELAVDSILR
jgi:Uma2 family endonuclease